MSEGAQQQLNRLWMAAENPTPTDLAITSTPSDATDELVQSGMAQWNDHTLVLTATGHREASQAIRRHRLAERLLVDILNTDEAKLDNQACCLEHVLFDGLDESICTLLGHPQFCPHGRPIPSGECCRQKQQSVDRLIAPLSELKPGQHGQIAYIHMTHAGHLQKLIGMGVLPGVAVKSLRRFPSFVFEAGYSQFAVDEEIAADIYVRLEHE